ncbi:MAG: hypothetical protein U0931_17760 [Vulcanimicrobiota bacterium]
MKWTHLLLALSLTSLSVSAQSIEGKRRALLLWCRENLAQQFTPGYKATITNYWAGARPDLDVSQGRVVNTNIPLHLAILGEGFFSFQNGHYSRDGRMILKNDQILGSSGSALLAYKLDEQGNITQNLDIIRFPMDSENKLFLGKYNECTFDAQGYFLGGVTNTDPVTGYTYTDYTPLYRLAIATFPQPHRLQREEGTMLSPSPESGPASLDMPGQHRLGFLVPRSVEMSNVDPVQQAYIWGRLDANETRPLPQRPGPKQK